MMLKPMIILSIILAIYATVSYLLIMSFEKQRQKALKELVKNLETLRKEKEKHLKTLAATLEELDDVKKETLEKILESLGELKKEIQEQLKTLETKKPSTE